MMKISVKLLANYRKRLPEGTPGNRVEIEIPAGVEVSEVLAEFNVPADSESVVLVNGRVPEPGQKLQQGDAVCAFPAIAGG